MKKYFTSYLAGIISAIIISISIFVFADDDLSNISVAMNKINIAVNGKQIAKVGDTYTLDNGDEVPFSIVFKGTTYLPMRKLGSLVGKDIIWDGTTDTAGLNDKVAVISTTAPATPTPTLIPSLAPTTAAVTPTPTPIPTLMSTPEPTPVPTPEPVPTPALNTEWVYSIIGSGNEVMITQYLGVGGYVNIPESIDGKIVTGIGESVFANFSNISSINIPNSVSSIGMKAFYACTNLSSITIPDGVTSIESQMFYNCNKLTSVSIPNSVTSIGRQAFYACTNLTSIAIPSSVTSIGEFAFSGCRNLTGIAIPNSLTNIDDYVFNRCEKLTSITIPSSVTSIGNQAFSGCTNLTSITMSAAGASINSMIFGPVPVGQSFIDAYNASGAGTYIRTKVGSEYRWSKQ